MGYTHYWGHAGIDTETWKRITDDVEKILKTTRVPLLHEYDEPGTKPEVSEVQIFLNGVEDDGHGTFFLTPNSTNFEFCRTVQKPYDQVVCAILIVAAKHAEIDVRSDGDVDDWKPGLALVTAACGPGYEIPLKAR